MTDRAHSMTVVLDRDMRDDDVESLRTAIRQFRNVIDVSLNVADVSDHVAQMRARSELGEKILGIIYPPKQP